MLKYIILLLICISYTDSVSGYSILIYPYDLSSNKWASCSYPSSYYYYVVGGSLHGHTSMNVQFTPRTHIMDSYYVTTKFALNSNNIDLFIDGFYDMALSVPVDYAISKTYNTDSDYPYMYFSFIAHPSSTYISEVAFDFKAYTISGLAAFIIVLIVIGALVCLAAISMGIAKAMGRSAWEGLACFCILCTICCCRR